MLDQSPALNTSESDLLAMTDEKRAVLLQNCNTMLTAMWQRYEEKKKALEYWTAQTNVMQTKIMPHWEALGQSYQRVMGKDAEKSPVLQTDTEKQQAISKVLVECVEQYYQQSRLFTQKMSKPASELPAFLEDLRTVNEKLMPQLQKQAIPSAQEVVEPLINPLQSLLQQMYRQLGLPKQRVQLPTDIQALAVAIQQHRVAINNILQREAQELEEQYQGIVVDQSLEERYGEALEKLESSVTDVGNNAMQQAVTELQTYIKQQKAKLDRYHRAPNPDHNEVFNKGVQVLTETLEAVNAYVQDQNHDNLFKLVDMATQHYHNGANLAQQKLGLLLLTVAIAASPALAYSALLAIVIAPIAMAGVGLMYHYRLTGAQKALQALVSQPMRNAMSQGYNYLGYEPMQGIGFWARRNVYVARDNVADGARTSWEHVYRAGEWANAQRQHVYYRLCR